MSDVVQKIKATVLALVPIDGTAVGNTALRREVEERLNAEGLIFSEADYWKAHSDLIEGGLLSKGQGRGGSVRLKTIISDGFSLVHPDVQATESTTSKPAKRTKPKSTQAATNRITSESPQIISYRHQDKRKNNPEVGMVSLATDPEAGKTSWAFDPHLAPSLQFDVQRSQVEAIIDEALVSGDIDLMRNALEELKRLQTPYLNWAGKAERTSFDVDTVSLHVHERVDPASILSAVRKAMKGEGKSTSAAKAIQPGLFDAAFENLPLRDAIDFYRHERGWANRLVAGDSLLVMNSLLQKESMAGKVQMIYFDPPYGIKYGSNFQPFVGKRDVKDRNDADLTQEPEMIKAFRDTWELGIHSYLTYLRDRLFLARELLHDGGSVFVQISEDNLHHVRELMGEIFGDKNHLGTIVFLKTSSATSTFLPSTFDYLVWYAKDCNKTKYRMLMQEKSHNTQGAGEYAYYLSPNGAFTRLAKEDFDDITKTSRALRVDNLTSQSGGASTQFTYTYCGRDFSPGNGGWKTNKLGMSRLERAGRLHIRSTSMNYRRFLADFPAMPLSNMWEDTAIAGWSEDKRYVVQTARRVIERCMLMTTDPGDLVLDPTCGSGTTAFVAEKWGRRWITCDTSRVAVTLAKQRLMTSSYDYFDLKYTSRQIFLILKG